MYETAMYDEAKNCSMRVLTYICTNKYQYGVSPKKSFK